MTTSVKMLLAAGVAAFAGALFAPLPAHAEYPDHPIRLIVPYAAGGSSDIVGRSFAQKFEQALGQPVVIENIGGAGGYAGALRVAGSKPDGYTLLIGSGSELLIRNRLQKQPLDNPMEGFTPISLIGTGPMVLVGKPDLKASSLADVIALAHTGKGLNYGTAGAGTFMHLVGEAVRFDTKSTMTHVPYRGAGPLMNDVLAGHVDVGVASLASALSFIKSGKVKALAVSSASRTEFAKEIPTLGETPALANFNLELWIGLFGPAKLPPEIAAKLQAAALKVLDDAELKTRLADQAIATRKLSGPDFAAFLNTENEKYRKIIADAEIPPQ